MVDRSHSEEAYVVGLLEEILGEPAMRGHRFDWLRGDPTARGRGVPLPVDAYWPTHKLVVEVYERQHDEPMPHFDKVDRVTVSGVHRGEQRRIYDQRRRDLLPAHGLKLLIVRTSDLAVDRRGRLLRDEAADRPVLAGHVRGALDDAVSPPTEHEGTAAPPLVDLTGVRVVRDYELELIFETGETRVVDMAGRLFGPLFEPLRADYELFRQVGVDAGTIVWPTGADWDPGELHAKSVPVTSLEPASQNGQTGEATPTTPPAQGARAGAAAGDCAGALPVDAPAWQDLLQLVAKHELADVRVRGDGTLVVSAPSPGYAEVARFAYERLAPGGARFRLRPDDADVEALRTRLATGPSPVAALIDERRAEAQREDG
jgi:hypothetical protein